MSAHHCHANNCTAATSPRMLMCAAHWRMVPKALQQAVYDAYRPGQERDKNPSLAWVRAARAAINSVSAVPKTDKNSVRDAPTTQIGPKLE